MSPDVLHAVCIIVFESLASPVDMLENTIMRSSRETW